MAKPMALDPSDEVVILKKHIIPYNTENFTTTTPTPTYYYHAHTQYTPQTPPIYTQICRAMSSRHIVDDVPPN